MGWLRNFFFRDCGEPVNVGAPQNREHAAALNAMNKQAFSNLNSYFELIMVYCV